MTNYELTTENGKYLGLTNLNQDKNNPKTFWITAKTEITLDDPSDIQREPSTPTSEPTQTEEST